MKCDKCGSENIIDGKLSTGFCGVVFATKKSQKRLPFSKNYSTITATACKDCGHIFNLVLIAPERIDVSK